MKKFSTIEEAKSAIEELIEYWSDTVTITNLITTSTLHGAFIDMTADRVSYHLLEEICRTTGDCNPIVLPIDEETINIGTYVIINDSGE